MINKALADVQPTAPLKVSWTWEEWMQSRAARREMSKLVGPAVIRRRKSSADRRLRAAFSGQRAP